MKNISELWVLNGSFVQTSETTIASCNSEANARLIVSAPEMLSALEEYVRYLKDDDKSYYGMLFKQLITKAKGV